MRVDLATRHHRAAVCAMLARAFADDPAMSWILPDRRSRVRKLPALFKMLFDSDAAHGVRLVTQDGAAATFWRAPGAAATSASELMRAALPMLTTFGFAVGRAVAVSRAIDAHMPTGDFWYLHVAGCDPAEQGKGTGKLVVQAGIDRLASGGLPVYLETATEANLGFYQNLGFRVIDEWHVPGGGPRFWSMMRAG